MLIKIGKKLMNAYHKNQSAQWMKRKGEKETSFEIETCAVCVNVQQVESQTEAVSVTSVRDRSQKHFIQPEPSAKTGSHFKMIDTILSIASLESKSHTVDHSSTRGTNDILIVNISAAGCKC